MQGPDLPLTHRNVPRGGKKLYEFSYLDKTIGLAVPNIPALAAVGLKAGSSHRRLINIHEQQSVKALFPGPLEDQAISLGI